MGVHIGQFNSKFYCYGIALHVIQKIKNNLIWPYTIIVLILLSFLLLSFNKVVLGFLQNRIQFCCQIEFLQNRAPFFAENNSFLVFDCTLA